MDGLIILILVILILFLPWVYGGMVLSAQMAMVFGISLVSLLWIGKKIRAKDFSLPPVSLFLPFFLFFPLGVSNIMFSVYPHSSLVEFLKISSYFLLFLVVSDNTHFPWQRLVLIGVIIFAGIFLSGYGLFQYFGFIPRDWWANKGLLASRFVNHNHFAGFLELVIPLSIVMMLVARRILVKIVLGISMAILFTSFAFASSRASWFVLVLILFILGFLLIRERIFKKKFMISIFSIALGMGIALFLFGGYDKILSRFSLLREMKYYSLFQRLAIWKNTLAMIREHPWGTGLGTFRFLFPQYRTFSDRFTVNYAHNEYLQLASEAGWVGLGLGLWILIWGLRRTLMFIRREKHIAHQLILIGVFAGGAGILVHSLVDFQLHIPANAFLLTIMAGLAFSIGRAEGIEKRLSKRVFFPLLVLLSFLGGLFSLRIYLAEGHFQRGKEREKKFYYEQAIGEYKEAIVWDRWNALYHAQLGELYAKRSRFPGQGRWREMAIQCFQRATSLNPYDSLSHLKLAWLYAYEGNKEEAKDEFEKAISIEPMNAYFHYSYAVYGLESNLPNSFREFRKALILFHEGYDLLSVLNKCYQVTSDYEKLKEVVPQDSHSLYRFGSFLAQKGRWEEAEREFNRAIALSEDKLGILLKIGKFFRKYDRKEEATRIFRKVLTLDPENRLAREFLEERR